MELIQQEIPLGVDSAAQDATKLMSTVVASVYRFENLNALAFLTCTGKQAQLTSDKLADRPENLILFRFSYNLDPSMIDPRITQKPTFF